MDKIETVFKDGHQFFHYGEKFPLWEGIEYAHQLGKMLTNLMDDLVGKYITVCNLGGKIWIL